MNHLAGVIAMRPWMAALALVLAPQSPLFAQAKVEPAEGYAGAVNSMVVG